MIWESPLLMGVIDLAVIGATLLLALTLLRHMSEVRALGLTQPIVLLVLGTLIVGIFHLLDLGTMTVLPLWLGHSRAMEAMTTLHLEGRWFVTVFTIGLFTVGISLLLRDLLPRLVASMRSDAAAKAALAEANIRLEEAVMRRTQQLEEDVRVRRRTEQELRRSEARYRGLFEGSPIALWEEDWSGVRALVEEYRLSATESLRSCLELHPELLVEAASRIRVLDVNRRTLDLHGAPTKKSFIETTRRRLTESPRAHLWEQLLAFADGLSRVVSEVEEIRQDGTRFVARMTLDLPVTQEGDWSRVLVSMEDITEFRELSSKLSYQASHDALTGLINRREFDKRLRRVLESARSDAGSHALCYLDLDQFKVVNDACGHTAGDELLRQVAGLLAARVRRRDTLARLGGDEFGILLEHCSLEQARRLGDAILAAMQAFRFRWEGRIFSVGVSIGLVPISADSGDAAFVMREADAACYAAKERGRNRLQVYRDSDVILLERRAEMNWVARIGEALEHDYFRLYAQPIVPAGSAHDKGVHHELLLRLAEPDGSVVTPGVFLPAAERYGLSSRIDRWVVRNAFSWYAAHPTLLDSLQVCAINLSGQSLGDKDMLAFLIRALEDFGFPGGKLCLEITETAAVGDFASADKFIGELRRRQVRFALDDFGSGLSSFGYLKSLPVDFLKIDGQFVKDIVDDPVDRAMVRSINEIGHVIGKQTIAEFVENDAIRSLLVEMGVDYVQGYAVGRPQPMADLLASKSTG